MRKIKEVLKHRFKTKKEPALETVDISGLSVFISTTPARYYFSEDFALYEMNFSKEAASFYAGTNPDEFNEDVFDAKILIQAGDEIKFADEQRTRHFNALELIHMGILRDKNTIIAAKSACEESISRKEEELKRLTDIYHRFERNDK